MIELQHISSANFVTYESFDLPLHSLSDNVLFISGENLDAPLLGSNGAGKSLIYDMITWCCWEKTVRGMKANEVIGPFAKRTYVRLTFQEGKATIIVRRERKPGNSSLEVDISENNASTGLINQNAQEFIDEFLMPWSVAKNAIVMGQDDVDRFVNMTDATRKSVISDLRGLNIFDEARELVKVDLKVKEADKRNLENRLDSDTRKLAHLEQMLAEAKARVLREVPKLTGQITHDNKEIDRINKALKQISNNQDEIRHLEIMLDRNKKMFDDYLIKTRARKSVLNKKKNKFETNFAVIDNEIKQINKHWHKEGWKIKQPKKMIGRKCNVCGVTMVEENLAEFIAEQKKLYDADMVALKKLHWRRDRYSDIAQKLDEKIKTIETDAELIGNLANSERRKLELKISDLELENSKWDNLVKLRTKHEESIYTAQLHISSLRDSERREEKFIENTQQSIDDTKSELEKARLDYAVLQYLNNVFGPKGAKAYSMIDTAEDMNAFAGDVMQFITDGAIQVNFTTGRKLKSSKEVTPDFDILLTDNTKPNPIRYVLWSGGEKERIAFGIVMAFMMVIGSKVNLLLIDEAIDKNISDIGVSRILDYLQSLDRKILIISHKFDIRNRFSSIMHVTKSSGKSEAELQVV